MPAIDQGARYSPIRWEDRWFRGEDKRLRFKVTLPDGTVPDMDGWTFGWFLREEVKDPDPILVKSAGDVTVIVGPDPEWDQAPPPPNIDLVNVTIPSADTASLLTGTYYHALVRTDAGNRAVLAEGEAVLRASAGG
jgi:hypothetical protein